ncbi:hypothetical protein D3C76_820290 [compost metagenome]
MLGHQGVDGRHAGNVDDRDLRTGVDDALQQRFHDGLAALGVQRADQRQGQHAVPQLDHWGGQFQQFFLLTLDHFLTGFLEGAHGVHAEPVEQFGNHPQLLGQSRWLIAVVRLQQAEQRALEGEDEIHRLVRVMAKLGAGGREFLEETPRLIPAGGGNIVATVGLQAIDQQLQEIAGFLGQRLLFDIARGTVGVQARNPLGQQFRLIVLDCVQRIAVQCCHVPSLLCVKAGVPMKWPACSE